MFVGNGLDRSGIDAVTAMFYKIIIEVICNDAMIICARNYRI